MLLSSGTPAPIASATGTLMGATGTVLSVATVTLGELHEEITNQIEAFSDHQAYVQRILATSSSCASIAACLVAIYMFLAIDPRRLIFRHQLITFLLVFDFIKAIILLLYPTRVLTHSTSYYNSRFCQVVGFFTAMSIEGADIAILAFAVHTYLLIFKPGLTTKVNNSTRQEGGLYRYRYIVYVLSFVIPVFMASLAFIGVGYIPLVCWCYLPQQPVWSRFVLSWVPRYLIVISIFVIYGLIYFHVIREFKTLGGVFTTIHKSHQTQLYPHVSHDEKPSFFSALKFSIVSLRDRIFPKFILPDQALNPAVSRGQLKPNQLSKSQQPKRQVEDDEDEDDENHSDFSSPVHVDTENIIYDPEIHAANLAKFRKRQKIIEKQMKSIFIYPFAYCFIWLFPFMLQATQVNHEREHGPIYWLNVMGAFMQPFNGFVDSMVFFYREQPWKYTIMGNFEKEYMTKMDTLITTNNPPQPDRRQSRGSGRETESIATSAILTKNSLSASTGLVDSKQYALWRQWMSWFRLPLFTLPNEENMSKFQLDYISRRLVDINSNQRNSATLNIGSSDDSSKDYNEKLNSFGAGVNKHDFSDLLRGDVGEKDFRNNLENFSFNSQQDNLQVPAAAHQGSFHHKRLSLGGNSSNSSRRKSSIGSLGRSSKSRQVSIIEPSTDPILFEGKKTSYPTKRGSNGQSFSGKRGHSGLNSRTSVSSKSVADDEEMDFMDFLRNGP